jgi:pyruvate kinase
MRQGVNPVDDPHLMSELQQLRARVLSGARALDVSDLQPGHRLSACNLAHYLAFRQCDLRELQQLLARAGLSSLGRNEAHVVAGLDSVLGILHRLHGDARVPGDAALSFDAGESLLVNNAARLLGESPSRRSRIMVTMPTEASTEPELVEALVREGMDLMRINCAHDDQDAWRRMAQNLERARRVTGRACALYADLAGPKLRSVALHQAATQVELGQLLLLQSQPGEGRLGCTLPEAVAAIEPGHRVFFDDGKVSCVAVERAGDAVLLKVVGVTRERAKIKPDAGINLPDSSLPVESLTPKDLEDLSFVVEHADVVGLSFVRKASDVTRLQAELRARDAQRLGVVLKIETAEAFQALPQLLLAALRSERAGVMVARGDLAVEIGFERLAEVQEEILWVCEAAHVPVIWATQVLEQLAKKGLPSRAEVTDAAMSVRAECVMLNKGPHVVEAVRFLDGVLRRMQEHQDKRRTLLRRLSLATSGWEPAGAT